MQIDIEEVGGKKKRRLVFNSEYIVSTQETLNTGLLCSSSPICLLFLSHFRSNNTGFQFILYSFAPSLFKHLSDLILTTFSL